MKKIDLKKELKYLYNPSAKEVTEIDVPAMNFLMIDGDGGPGSAEFSSAIEALFSLSYTIKFVVKKGELQIDYKVMPLEGLWWSDDMSAFVKGDKDKWKWTLMIMQPDFISSQLIDMSISDLKQKKNPESLHRVKYSTYLEGLAAQTMHIGPFSEEGPTITKVHDFIRSSGKQRVKKHHEIYLSDIRRASPEKWRTVIRQPMI